MTAAAAASSTRYPVARELVGNASCKAPPQAEYARRLSVCSPLVFACTHPFSYCILSGYELFEGTRGLERAKAAAMGERVEGSVAGGKPCPRS